MTNNPTIDGVSRDQQRIKGMIEAAGGEYAIMIDPENSHFGWTFKRHPDGQWVSGRKATEPEMYAARQYAKSTGQLDAPTNDLREHCKQCAEVVKTWPEWKQNCLGGAPAAEQQERTAHSMKSVAEAVDASRCYIVLTSNQCYALAQSLNNQAVRVSAAENSTLQSTIAQLQAEKELILRGAEVLRERIAELESGSGEPVCYQARHSEDEPWFFTDKPGYWEWRPLFAAPPAPVAVVLPERKIFSPPSYRDGHAEGWNACLDATAALNEVKP